MTPQIKKQKKLFINQGGNNSNNTNNFSRLEATAVAEIPTFVS